MEVQISLRIAGDRSDVMKSGDFMVHLHNVSLGD
jgi:hypothetical protein